MKTFMTNTNTLGTPQIAVGAFQASGSWHDVLSI